MSEAQVKPATPSWRLISTLGVAGAMAGLLIVLVFGWAEPRILDNQARAIAAAIDEVLHDPARTETLFLVDGALTTTPPAGTDTLKVDRVWAGYDDDGRRVGFAMLAAEPGFQDLVHVIFGFDAESGTVLGMRVLDNKETPGLGDKIVKDSAWVAGFEGAAAPLVAVKPGTGTGADNEVDTITGATISSRVVIQIIDNRIAQVRPLLPRGAQ